MNMERHDIIKIVFEKFFEKERRNVHEKSYLYLKYRIVSERMAGSVIVGKRSCITGRHVNYLMKKESFFKIGMDQGMVPR